MKNLFILAVVLFLFAGCYSNSTKVNTKAFDKGVVLITTTFPNITSSTAVIYDGINQIKAINLDEDDEGFEIRIEYNKQGLPFKINHFYGDSIVSFKTIEWYKDSLQITKTIISGKEENSNFRETYFYNESKDIIKIVRYMKDDLGMWQKRGSKYEFEWDNGNMVKSLCYISGDHENNDSVIISNNTDDAHMFSLDDVSHDRVKDDNYTLYYTSVYTYDSQNNPYKNTSITEILLPNESNISVNNPVTIEKKYAEGEEIKFTLDYVYNELGYPTKIVIDVTSNMEGLEKTQYTREFKY